MKWITRENAKVDRIACPWLIRRFVDRDAEFLFVHAELVKEKAAHSGAVPYDVPGAELGHVDGRCSFESILLKYDLAKDPGLARLGRIVHAADVSEDLATSPQGAGLLAMAQGFALVHGTDDHRKLELQGPVYDALYAWCLQQANEA